MKNQKRSETFMTIRRWIKSCENQKQLETIRERVMSFLQKNNKEGWALLIVFAEKEKSFHINNLKKPK